MKYKNKFITKMIVAVLAISLGVVLVPTAFAQDVEPLYLTGNVTINGAWFEQYTLEGSTGTGTFHPFLQVNQIGGHAKSPVYGYSTDIDPLNTFCEGATPKVPGTPGTTGVFYTTEPT